MPAIRDFASTGTHVSGLTLDVVLPRYVEGDLLLLIVQHDSNGSWDTPTGWTQIYNRLYGSGVSIFWKVAGATEAVFAVTNPGNDGRNATILSIYDYNQSNPFGATPNIVDASRSWSTYMETDTALTTTEDNCLVMHMVFTSFVRNPIIMGPNLKYGGGYLNSNQHGFGFSYSFKETAGATGTGNVVVCDGTPGSSIELLLQISPPATGSTIFPAHVVEDEGAFLTPYATSMFPTPYGNMTVSTNLSTSWSLGLGGLSIGSANSLTSLTERHMIPDILANQMSASGDETTAAGGAFNLGTGLPMEGDYALLVHMACLSSSPQVFGSIEETAGICIALQSSDGNNKGFIVGAKEVSGLGQVAHLPHVVVPSADAQYQTGTLDPTLVNSIGFFAINGATGKTAASFYIYQFWLIRKVTICGGDASNYCEFKESMSAFSSDKQRYTALFQGSTQALVFQPVVVGNGGTNKLYFNWSFSGLEFASTYSVARRSAQMHAPDNWLGLLYNLGPNDVMDHSNAVVSSSSRFHWGLHANSSVLATYNFTRLSVVGAGTITLNKAITINRLTINDYVTCDISNATLTNCIIAGAPSANDSLTTNSSTSITGANINVSGVASGNRWCSIADPSIFSGCSFEGGGGHAIRITTPGTYTFNANQISGFGVNGSDGAFLLNDSGGLVTINVAGGGSTPSVKNVGASTTVINSGASLTINGLIENSEVRVYLGTNPDTAVEIAGIENSGTSFTLAHSNGGEDGYIVIHSLNYQSLVLELTFPSTDASIPVKQIRDRQYDNPI